MPSGAICKWVVFVLMAVSTLPTRGAPAAKTAATRQAAAASVPVPAAAEDITLDIEVQTSRANPVVGSDLGITAVFKNTSKRAKPAPRVRLPTPLPRWPTPPGRRS